MVTITPLHLKQAGFSDETITKWINTQRPLLKKAGFSDMEINNAYGLRVINSDSLSTIEQDNKLDSLISDTTLNEDKVEKSNKNTVGVDSSKVSTNKVNQKLEKIENSFHKLSKEDKSTITKMLVDAQSKFEKDDEGKVKFIDNYLSTHFPNITFNDIKETNDNIEAEAKLFLEAQEKVDTKKIDDIEAREILQGNVGYNSATKRFTYSKEYEDLYRDERIEKKTSKLEKEVRDEKKKLYVLNAPLTTGKHSSQVISHLSSVFGWNENQANNWNNFFSYMSAMESDNRNVYSRDGEAKGVLQIRSSSMSTHLNRLVALKTQMDKNYQLETWVEEAYKHKDATKLTLDQQKALVMANLYMITENKRLNRKGTNDLIKRIADGDTKAMAELYKNYHHADYQKTMVAGKALYNVRENKNLDKRIDAHLSLWGSDDVGYESPKLATWSSNLMAKEGFAGKMDAFISYYLGGQGNRNVFKQGYSNSVIGLIDHYNDWAIANPNATEADKEDMMKQMFMYSENQTFSDEVVQSATTLLFDSPIMAAGCFAASGAAIAGTGGLAAPAAPAICMGAAFALPEVMRSALMEGMISGRYKDFSEFWDDFMSAKTAEVGAKMFGLGAVTGTAGVMAKSATLNYLNKPWNTAKYNQRWATGSRLTAEIYVMTDLGSRMENHVPTLRDFAHTAVLIFGFHATVGQVKNLMNIYKNHSVHPKDLLKIVEENPHVREELKDEKSPKFLEEHQIKLMKELEEKTKQKLLTPPKFMLNEKINISPESTEKGIIVSKEVVKGEIQLIVKRENGETVTINEKNARKLDDVQEFEVKIENDGNLDIKPKEIKDVDAPETGSKSDKVSFKEQQNGNDYSLDIVEINRVDNKVINKDGSQYKSTVKQTFDDLGSDKRKIVSNDGIASSDGKLLVRNEFYPKVVAELNKKNKKGESIWDVKQTFKTANEMINKAFNGLTAKHKKISIIFAVKKGTDVRQDTLVGKVGNQLVFFSRKAYETLITFTENGKQKTAKLVAQKGDRPLVFLHPESNKVIGLLMPLRIEKGEPLHNQAKNYWAEYADQGNSGTAHYSKRTRESKEAGIPNDPYTGNNLIKPHSDPWHRFFENGRSIDYYSIVTLIESLLGKLPELKNLNNSKYIGVFKHLKEQNPNIPLRKQAEINIKRALQDNPADFLKTLTHELGHLIDFVPDRTLTRGNILGHIAGLKRYLVHWIDGRNDGSKPLDKAEIKTLKKRAEKLAKEKEKSTDKEIEEVLKITPKTILEIFNDAKAREKIDPEFYDAFAKLDKALKKEVIKDALKGLMSNHLKAIADKINGKKVDPKLTDEAYKIFKELFEKEIKERGLVNVEIIRKELKALSDKWHPWDRAIAPESYRKYRDSSSELMAEFMMAWLLQPNWVKFNAPRAYDLWMHHIKNRSEVKELYTKIQNDLNSPKEVRDSIIYNEVMTKWGDSQKKAEVAIKDGVEKMKINLDDLGTEVIDVFWWIYKQAGLETKRGNGLLSKDLKKYIELYRYRSAELSQYMRDLKFNILKDLENTQYNENQLGYMLTLMNLARSKQREGKITWKFFPMKEGDKVLFQKYEGDIVGMYERYVSQHPELLKIARKFLYVRRKQVTRMILESNVFSKEQKKFIKENPYYITFQPIEVLLERLNLKGKHGWATKHIKETKGTFELFDNPYLSTVTKDLLILAEIKRQNAFHGIVQFLLHNHKSISDRVGFDVIYKPKYVKEGVLEPVKSPQLKRIYLFRNGKMSAFDIEKKTAEAMIGNPLYSWWSVSKLATINSVYRGIFTEHNPLFWAWNWGFRDLKRSFIMLPNGKEFKLGKNHLTNRIKYMVEVIKAFKPAIKDIYGNGTELTRFMNKNGFLISPEEGYRSEAGMKKAKLLMDEDSMMLKRLIYKEEANGMFQKLHEKTTQKYLLHSGRIARILERTHKIGYFNTVKHMIDTKQIDMTMTELMHEVTDRAGSPNYLRQGKANPILNQLLLFFNANKEGIRGDIEAVIENPKAKFKNFVYWSIMPKMLEKIILYGGLGGSLAVLYQSIPDYDRNNFNVVVIGKKTDKNGYEYPIYIRFPMDFNSQTIVGTVSMAFDTAFGLNKHLTWDEKMGMFMKQMALGLPQQTPFFTMMYDVFTMIGGGNPLNRWDAPVLDRNMAELSISDRGGVKGKEILKYLWNTNGGNFVYKFDQAFDNKSKISKEYERLTGFPIVDPFINRFVKIGNHPVIKKYNEKKMSLSHSEALVAYDLRTAIDKLVDSKEPLTKEEKFALSYTNNLANNSYLIEKLAVSGEGLELLGELLGADSKEMILILQAIEEIRLQKAE
jgi:hypothetical protein